MQQRSAQPSQPPQPPRLHAIPTLGVPPPELVVEFRSLPEPGDPPRPPLTPPWEVLRDQCGRTTRECFRPEHGRPALALTRLINLVMLRETRDAASVISFTDLHTLLADTLIGDDLDG
jgi:hypothetical protein